MQIVWRGAISFGLVHVPVKMFTATENNDISFRTLHKVCSNPISQTRSCTFCNVSVSPEDTAKGYEYSKGKYVLISDEELESLKPETARTIQIINFVNLVDIDPIYFEKAYYLSPDISGSGAYNLLMEAIRQTGKIGIAKVTIRTKSRLAAVRVFGNCISGNTSVADTIRKHMG